MTNKPITKLVGIEIAVNFYDNNKCSETCRFLDSDEYCLLFNSELENTKQRCEECVEKEIK
jgi:hypothetical protein